MSSRRQNEHLIPPLFPFLAVLLCTIGALVLILAMSVTYSYASAKNDAETKLNELKDAQDEIQFVSEELSAQRDDLKSKVERRRRELANIEDHITRLQQELKQLAGTLQLIQSDAARSDQQKTDKSSQVEQLKEQIEAKKKELKEEIDKQKNRKPAFAIVPYEGKNGTNRRPVYLECTKAGVLIQPEGLLISAKDLRPPLGPGNPLDAALRVLRIAFQQKDATFGITQPPYPLLLVRPDGIQTYALAREAMKGWDDQFGYELIEQDMALTFPESVSGLKEQLASSIEVAKQRQQAYAASMPRSNISVESEQNWDEIDATIPSSAGRASNAANSSPSMEAVGGDWKLVQAVSNSKVNGQNSSSMGGGQPNPGTGHANGLGSNAPQPIYLPQKVAGGGADLTGSFVTTNAAGAGNPINPLNQGYPGNPGAGNSPNESSAGNSSEASQNQGTSSLAGGSSGGGAGAANNNGSGNVNGAAFSNQPGSGSPPPPGMNALSGGSATGAGGGSPAEIPENVANAGNLSSVPSLSVTNDASHPKAKHVREEGDLKPISVSAGRGWAASRAEGTATPVTRPINLIALKDRWLLRSDVDPQAFEASISMEQGPQQAGNELATALRKRVDSWGLSLPGGYWSPTLTIEAANDAQQSVARLERLLEGSGVEIKVVPLRLTNR